MEITPFQEEIESPFDHQFKKSKKFHGNFNGPIGIYSMKSKHRGVFFFVNIINFQKPEMKREAGVTDRDKLIILFREMGLECFYYEDISKDVRLYFILFLKH